MLVVFDLGPPKRVTFWGKGATKTQQKKKPATSLQVFLFVGRIRLRRGGAKETRTPDLLYAIQAL